MSDAKNFVQAIYPNAVALSAGYCKVCNRNLPADMIVIVNDQFYNYFSAAGLLLSGFEDTEDIAWKKAAEYIQHNMLRKLEL